MAEKDKVEAEEPSIRVEMIEEKAPEATYPAISAKQVTKRFGPTIAVNDVTFEVQRGEVVGFLGPNGSGKTTTMRLLTSFYTPDTGSILIDGVDNQENDVLTRQKIGYLPENNPIYGDLLVSESLNFVAELRGLSRAERRASIDEAVVEAGIEEVYYLPVRQCSKGYRQRVGLAQAILHHPDILIMDEPTEGLDPNQRVPIRELIKSMGQDRTVLFSSHVLQEVEAVASRLLIISRGRIVGQGTVEELRQQAQKDRYIDLEVEGEGVEAALEKLAGVDSLDRLEPANGRNRFVLSVSGEGDIRPEIFKLAKKQDWVIWELHAEVPRLEDLFHELTTEDEQEEED